MELERMTQTTVAIQEDVIIQISDQPKRICSMEKENLEKLSAETFVGQFNRDFKIGDYGQRTTNEDERELGRGALRMLKTKHNYVVRCVPARYDSFPGFSRSL